MEEGWGREAYYHKATTWPHWWVWIQPGSPESMGEQTTQQFMLWWLPPQPGPTRLGAPGPTLTDLRHGKK